MEYQTTEVVEIERPAPGYALLRFRGERPLDGVPGQFVMVRGEWGADLVLPRAFSLVEVGEGGAILVRAVGAGTRRLARMERGDRLSVLGPAGKGFSTPDDRARPVLVAGGVGVAPLIFLAERLWEEGVRPIFLYGARTAQDLPLRERLEAATELHVATEDGSAGEHGLVTEPLGRVLAEAGHAQLFACGPEPMLAAVAGLAAGVGASCEVALESPMACGMGTCKGCAVRDDEGEYRYVCTDGPVFDGRLVFGGGR